MNVVDPQIIFYGQWGLFIAAYIFGIWATGYLLWMSIMFGIQWHHWLELRRDFRNAKNRVDVSHYESVKRLELKELEAKKTMELARETAFNSEIVGPATECDHGPVPIKSKSR